MKRVTAAIFDRYLDAWSLAGILRRAGVEHKIVHKYAVQVHPEQVEPAKAALRVEEARLNKMPHDPSQMQNLEDIDGSL